jgi:hypothetical protein
MPNTAIWVGRILLLIGIIGYAYGLYSGNASPTALIPAAFGVLLMIFGHVALRSEGGRKHLMHAALLIALIGFVVPATRLLSKASELTLGAALLSQLAMAIVCLLFVILGVRSFIAARATQE